jgi:branched-chain amino acid transport system substrate-binding protein
MARGRGSGFRPDRRGFLRTLGAAGAAAVAGGCTSGGGGADQAAGGGDVIRIGYVSPESGVLTPFGETDLFVIGALQEFFTRNPIQVGGRA